MLGMAEVLKRNNVTVGGRVDGQPMVFAHGFGCDQNMWRFVTPAFEDRYRIVLFDHVGSGNSDWSAYDRSRYSTLAGYACFFLPGLFLHGLCLVSAANARQSQA